MRSKIHMVASAIRVALGTLGVMILAATIGIPSGKQGPAAAEPLDPEKIPSPGTPTVVSPQRTMSALSKPGEITAPGDNEAECPPPGLSRAVSSMPKLGPVAVARTDGETSSVYFGGR